jgi:hypothetical protein
MGAEALWYSTVGGPRPPEPVLEQGDIIGECPRFSIDGVGADWPLPEEAAVTVDFDQVPAVVLTQTCDLVQKKVSPRRRRPVGRGSAGDG